MITLWSLPAAVWFYIVWLPIVALLIRARLRDRGERPLEDRFATMLERLGIFR